MQYFNPYIEWTKTMVCCAAAAIHFICCSQLTNSFYLFDDHFPLVPGRGTLYCFKKRLSRVPSGFCHIVSWLNYSNVARVKYYFGYILSSELLYWRSTTVQIFTIFIPNEQLHFQIIFACWVTHESAKSVVAGRNTPNTFCVFCKTVQ